MNSEKWSDLERLYKESSYYRMGCDFQDLSLVMGAVRRDQHKPICVIKGWVWIEWVISNRKGLGLYADKQRLTKVYGRNVIMDEQGRFPAGNWVLSSYLHHYHAEKYVFETANTLYLLVGPGFRKTINLIHKES